MMRSFVRRAGPAILFVALSVGLAGARPGVPTTLQSVGEQAEAALNELAVAYAFEGRVLDPIPLDPGRPELGMALLPIHRKVLMALAQLGSGAQPDLPVETGARPAGPGIILIAFPLDCSAGVATPREIVYIGRTAPGESGPVRLARDFPGDRVGDLLPGLDVPRGALIRAYRSRVFTRPDDAVIVRYESQPCGMVGSEIRLPVEVTMPRLLHQVHAPSATTAGTVRMRALIDLDGAPRSPAVDEGNPTLHLDALRIAADWRFAPGAINGTPVPLAAGLIIRFGSGGG